MTGLRKAIIELNETLESLQINDTPQYMIDIYEDCVEFLEIAELNLILGGKNENDKWINALRPSRPRF